MSYSSSEIKSGAIVVLSVILLIALTFKVGNFLGGKTQTWQVEFGYAGGLAADAPVYYAGNEVGKVDKVEIRSTEGRPVLITIRFKDFIKLRADSKAYVDTLGMLGEKFIELSPGSMDAPFLQPGNLIPGVDPIPMHQMMGRMNLLAERMDELTQSLNPMISKMNVMVSGHEEEIAKTISNLHEISSNLRDMTGDLKEHPWKLVRKP